MLHAPTQTGPAKRRSPAGRPSAEATPAAARQALPLARGPTLQVSLARNGAERREAQRLRYLVFATEMGAQIGSTASQVDEDEFDEACEHLLVRESRSGQVVGTYRILSPACHERLGRLYADAEFDLSALRHLLPSLVEVGRSCVHPDYRAGATLMLLWSGLTQYMLQGRYQHLIGCASASLADGGTQVATLRDRLQPYLVAPALRVRPHLPFAHQDLPRNTACVMPPLIKGYLRLGARICGEPAWDRQFACADFLVWLSFRDMAPRYARRFKMASGAGDPARC